MSRIGNKHIILPAGVTVEVKENSVLVKGPKGELLVPVNHDITVKIEGTTLICERANDQKQIKQNHGTTRANIANAVKGVSEGYKSLKTCKNGIASVVKNAPEATIKQLEE